ncbi:MAG: class I tRNA ligase family protein [Sphingomonadaceae bacterium]
MAAMESQGRDIKMDEKRVEGYRNFATKLWNATRFCQSNGIGASTTLAAPQAKLAANQWIIGEVQQTVEALDKAMADLRFDAAANTIYQFTWSQFCDWYLELIKPTLNEDAVIYPEHADETKRVAGWVLDQIYVMLHPFMPFITEELWNAQGEREYELILAKWPNPRASIDDGAKQAVDWFIELTRNIRAAKNELGISPGQRLVAYLEMANPGTQNFLNRWHAALGKIARLEVRANAAAPAGAAMQVSAGSDVFIIPLEGIVDIDAEKARLEKALAASQKEAKSLEGRLGNASFIERAKPEAVEKAKADHAHHTAEVERLTAALARLG